MLQKLFFFQQGFEHTSMDQVASVAGVSKRTVYNHFENKDVLFQAILVFMFEKVRKDNAVLFNSDKPVNEQLTQIAVFKSSKSCLYADVTATWLGQITC